MSRGEKVETKTVKVPGATLYVEARGTGPVLLGIIGGPTDAGMFTDLAGRLAHRYTVTDVPAGTHRAVAVAKGQMVTSGSSG